MVKRNNILYFETFSQFSSVIHGFSTSFFGSLRPSDPQYQDSLEKFTKGLGITTQQLVRMHQVHSNTVVFVSEKDSGQIIEKADGIITSTTQLFLGVVTGDCIPLLFFDPKLHIVSAVHAGWRGLYAEIIKETIYQMKEKRSDPKDIVVGIGPSIRVCCYDIPKERADMYLEKFPDWKPFIVEREGKLFFNLSGVAKLQLQASGVLTTNIEDADYCTFDHTDVYSYRREGEDFGEMMGIIGKI